MAYALDATIYRQRLLQRCSHELCAVLVVLPVATACPRGVMDSGSIERALAIAKYQ